MNTQKFPDFVIVGPTSDELVEEGYFTDVTKYAQKYHDMDIKVRITPNINLMLAQLSRSENQNVEWYDELDSFLTEMRNEIINMDKKNLKDFESYKHMLTVKYKETDVWLAMDCTNEDSLHIFTPQEY
jgi:hypothetical protein|tara:strand:+ start:163 stop:546 length:384 start_codon:yes stop_codon:yes gene_type:complete